MSGKTSPTPIDKLRAEFGSHELGRVAALTAFRLAAFIVLCIVGSQFLGR